jgi:phage terminase small subunit
MPKTKHAARRRDLFAREYVTDFNATQAAIRCGFSPKTAYSQGSRLLKNVEVASEIQALLRKRSTKVSMTADEVLEEIAKLAKFRPGDLLDEAGEPKPLHLLPPEVQAMVASIEFTTKGRKRGVRKFRLHDKLKALDLMGKVHGVIKDRHVLEDERLDPSEMTDEQLARYHALLEDVAAGRKTP